VEKTPGGRCQDVRGEARRRIELPRWCRPSRIAIDLGVHAASLEAVSADRCNPREDRVRGFGKPVLFRRMTDRPEIEAGPLRMKVALDEITGVDSTAPAPKSSSPGGQAAERDQ